MADAYRSATRLPRAPKLAPRPEARRAAEPQAGRMTVVRDPLPQEEYNAIYARVPRLTVEVVVTSADGVLLTRRESGPCRGLWHLPGGTVRLSEPLTEAVGRVAK